MWLSERMRADASTVSRSFMMKKVLRSMALDWGKGYAAKKFNEYFSNPENNPFLDESLYGKIDTTLQQQMQTIQSDEQESDNLVDELIDDMVGETFSASGNDDWKEAAWQRKLRRQSKVKLRRRKH